MVECKVHVGDVFRSLADETRRDILKRVAQEELAIRSLACHYHMTFAAVAKHVAILEKARLVRKRRQGKEQLVRLEPSTVEAAQAYLQRYELLWQKRFDKLDQLLTRKK